MLSVASAHVTHRWVDIERLELVGRLEPYETGERGSADPSRWANDRELEWVSLRPELVVEVAPFLALVAIGTVAGNVAGGWLGDRWRGSDRPRAYLQLCGIFTAVAAPVAAGCLLVHTPAGFFVLFALTCVLLFTLTAPVNDPHRLPAVSAARDPVGRYHVDDDAILDRHARRPGKVEVGRDPQAGNHRRSLDAAPGLGRQRLGEQLLLIDGDGQQQRARHRLVVVELGEEGAQHLARLQRRIGLREICAVAPVLAGAEEEHLDAGLPTFLVDGEDVGLVDGLRCDMAMLILREQVKNQWFPRVPAADFDQHFPGEFWPIAIETVREARPDFVFMAEVYSGWTFSAK